MASRYYVARHGTILDLAGRPMKPGTEIKVGDFPQKLLDEHVRSGFVRTVRDDNAAPHDVPGVEAKPPVGGEVDLTKQSGIITKGGEDNVRTSSRQAQIDGARIKIEGRWNLDPAVLANRPLEELNTMILERDPTIKPFETIPEAIGQLSIDFKK